MKEIQNKLNEAEEKVKKESTPTKRNMVIRGIKISDEQEEILKNGIFIYLENMNHNDDKGKFSSFVFLNDEKNRIFFSRENPDNLVKYGKYEMRIRDKIIIENGYMTKAKVKWWGGYANFAHPYLWKENPSDSDYQESWSDPRIKKEEKIEKQQDLTKNLKINRGRKM